MNQADSEKLTTIVYALCEAFGRKATTATFTAYEMGLDDLPIESIGRAAKRAIRENKFMPSPAELRELAGVPSDADRAALAWDVVLQSLSIGPYHHVDFDDGYTNATIRNLGGWVTFLSRFTDAEAEKWLRKEFTETYARLARAQVNGEMCRPLPGLKECEGGNPNAPPVPCRIETGLPKVERIGSNETARPNKPLLEMRKA